MTPVFGSYLVEMFTEPAKGRRGERVAWMQERSENAIALCGRLYGGLIAEGLYPELSSLRPGDFVLFDPRNVADVGCFCVIVPLASVVATLDAEDVALRRAVGVLPTGVEKKLPEQDPNASRDPKDPG